MLLDDATSRIQVEQALEDGDEELDASIREFLEEAKRSFLRSEDSYGEDQSLLEDGVETVLAENPAFIDEVIRQSPAEYDLSRVPRELVEESVKYTFTRSADRGRRGAQSWGPFSYAISDDRSSPRLVWSYDLSTTNSVFFSDSHFPDAEKAELIPENYANEFWKDLGRELGSGRSYFEWMDSTTTLGDNHASREGWTTYSFGPESAERWNEYCRDIVSEHVDNVIVEAPRAAVELFIKTSMNQSEGQEVLNLLDQGLLNATDLSEYVSEFFKSSYEDDQKAMLRDFRAAVLLKGKPEQALQRFIDEVTERAEKEIAQSTDSAGVSADVFKKAIADQHINKAELMEMAEGWFTGQDHEVLHDVVDYILAISDKSGDGPKDTRTVLATVSKEELKKLGIESGVLWEEAPWKLIKLRASDLGVEGRRMRHCVGDSTHYARSVANGSIEVWSLRDRNNKSRFTLEVESSFHDKHAEMEIDEVARARAIKQLKGKANRTPGFMSRQHERNSQVDFDDEVTLWRYLLKKLHVNPEMVVDFQACKIKPKAQQMSASAPRRGPSTWRLSAKLDSLARRITSRKTRLLIEDASFLLSE